MGHDQQEGGREMVLQKSDFQAPQHHEDLKIATKVACLVISVSTTAIFSFLAELSREQTGRARRGLLFKSGILLICASFFLALVLLILSLLRLKFSCSILLVRGTMWASAGLMALSLLLLLSYYFPASWWVEYYASYVNSCYIHLWKVVGFPLSHPSTCINIG